MTPDELNQWNSDLDALLARLTRLFYRTESRKHAEQFVRGLLAPLQRKNGWTIAEYVGEPAPKALQRFLNLTPWDVAELLKLNRNYAMGHLASEAAILVADPTGFAKKGRKSVGVQPALPLKALVNGSAPPPEGPPAGAPEHQRSCTSA